MYVMQADISAQDIHWHRGGLKGVIGSDAAAADYTESA